MAWSTIRSQCVSRRREAAMVLAKAIARLSGRVDSVSPLPFSLRLRWSALQQPMILAASVMLISLPRLSARWPWRVASTPASATARITT